MSVKDSFNRINITEEQLHTFYNNYLTPMSELHGDKLAETPEEERMDSILYNWRLSSIGNSEEELEQLFKDCADMYDQNVVAVLKTLKT